MAKSYKSGVMAEGVETIKHETALMKRGCELEKFTPLPNHRTGNLRLVSKPDYIIELLKSHTLWINAYDRPVKVFRYQPVHQTYHQLIIGRLMSKRLTMRKPREFNSVLWGLLDCLLVLVAKILSRYYFTLR